MQPSRMPRRRRSSRALLAGAAALGLLAVGGLVGATATTVPTSTLSGELHVSAAASLTDVYTELAATFEAANPDVDVVLNFGASSDLALQITEGAPADVFASADLNNMSKLADAELLAGEPTVFATNQLAIAVVPGNPEEVTGLDDLAARPELIFITTNPEVPIGRYTQQVFDRAGITVEVDSFEENVRSVAGKVQLDEADAGIVYATDIAATDGGLEAVAIPIEHNVIAVYPIAITAEAANTEAAAAFVAHVLSDESQAVLAAAGFGSPADAPAPVETTVPAESVPATTGA